ncbi:tRNA (adenosine(37)-N6)-dimethylallyltransferase MiaA [Metabacillus herbersteinensis]|uniref:tRNA dimethylallyltransferase n=1 Tax=Metabacillus herbersteinensis TaxID=283816 RepID=A0ABV6GCN5_9BACI
MERKKVVVLIGPTAVGKTKLSVDLALKLNGEIISGDSMQIYRGLDIGTAKIQREEMKGIPHYLVDIKDPDENYSVAEFQQSARQLIDSIDQHQKVPIIVGGTGLYIQSVLFDYQFSEAPSDPLIRTKLEEELITLGAKEMHNQLQRVDPKSSENIHANNKRRVIRALEIYQITGKTMSDYLQNQKRELLYDVVLIGLTMDRELLYERIELRVDQMVEQGLIEEVKNLYNKGIRNTQSIQAIGYKEIYEYIEGKTTLDDAIIQLKQNSRRYAKRQLTWFRNKMDVKWFDMTTPLQYEERVDEILSYIAGKLEFKANK